MSDKRVVYKNIRKHYEELEMCLADAKAHEEWNDVVMKTIPLVRIMTSRVLQPLTYSPTQ